jgi:hypothetical protein
MKTAVSLPNELFAEAERVAKRLGLSRSELYARAIAAYVREHAGAAITEAIDRVLASTSEGIDPVLARMQAESVGADEGSYEDWVALPAHRPTKASEPRGRSRKSPRRG